MVKLSYKKKVDLIKRLFDCNKWLFDKALRAQKVASFNSYNLNLDCKCVCAFAALLSAIKDDFELHSDEFYELVKVSFLEIGLSKSAGIGLEPPNLGALMKMCNNWRITI